MKKMTEIDRLEDYCGCCVSGRIRIFSRSQKNVWCHCCAGTGLYASTFKERLQALWRRLTTDYYNIDWVAWDTEQEFYREKRNNK